MNEKQEMMIFQLISAAGAAKSAYMEALQIAKEGKYEEAKATIAQGDEMYAEGHRAHAQMLAESAEGVSSGAALILVHAEDQMMSAETIKVMVEEMICLYQKLNK